MNLTLEEMKEIHKLVNEGGKQKREILTKYRKNWINYWNVDFNDENREEIIKEWKKASLVKKDNILERMKEY